MSFALRSAKLCHKLVSRSSTRHHHHHRLLLKRDSSCAKTAATSSQWTDDDSSSTRFKRSALVASAFVAGAAGLAFALTRHRVYCEQQQEKSNIGSSDVEESDVGKVIDTLPFYTADEVAKHGKGAERIWVSYKNGVYDVTEFIESHPGGNKILLGAGQSIETFWTIYAVHHKADVYEMLESLRIGNLKVDTSRPPPSPSASNDPYANDPKRSPLLSVLTHKPFNAESPKELSVEHLVTPNELHFVRNHLPVPHVDVATYELELVNEFTGKRVTLSYDELVHTAASCTVPVTLQCSGNRRKQMSAHEKVQGLMWDVNAISTARWTGVRLRDVLLKYGVLTSDDEARVKHVRFEGLDSDPTGSIYETSIPKEKAMSANGDVLLAYQMNGTALRPDQGYPVRVVVPGVVGARSVKWLKRVVLSGEQSKSHWQLNDYKVFPPGIKELKGVNIPEYEPINEPPVQSAICEPVDGAAIERHEGSFRVKGYAFSGGGRSINRVLVSLDDGNTWVEATLTKFDQPLYKAWAWTLWECELEVPADETRKELELVCVATDSEFNTQPEGYKSIWNARGMLNNAWHRIKIKLI